MSSFSLDLPEDSQDRRNQGCDGRAKNGLCVAGHTLGLPLHAPCE
jgi:hypothetical protein